MDVGNTRIKWRAVEQGDEARANPEEVCACKTRNYREFLDALERLDISDIIVSSVCPEHWNAEFARECKQCLSVYPRFVAVTPGLQGLQLAYEQPETLGVDRWLSMLAATQAYKEENILVVSAGTAITVDYISAQMHHLGGIIAPGVSPVIEGFNRSMSTLMLSESDVESSWRAGDTTRACLTAGLSSLYVGFLHEVIAQAPFDSGVQRCVLAGGNNGLLESLMPNDVSVCLQPFLVLDGLHVWSNLNKHC